MTLTNGNLFKAAVIVAMGGFILARPVAAAAAPEPPVACRYDEWCVDSCDDPSLFYNCDTCSESNGQCHVAGPFDCEWNYPEHDHCTPCANYVGYCGFES